MTSATLSEDGSLGDEVRPCNCLHTRGVLVRCRFDRGSVKMMDAYELKVVSAPIGGFMVVLVTSATLSEDSG